MLVHGHGRARLRYAVTATRRPAPDRGVRAASCPTVFSATYPVGLEDPLLYTAFENTGAIITGLKAAYRRRGTRPTSWAWPATEDRSTSAAGAVRGGRNEDVIYVCLDNGPMNTGIQRPSATPFGA